MTGAAVVTGASGFLGRAFTRELKTRGWDVRGVDVRPGPATTVGDISRPGAWTDVLEGADLLVHAAAIVGEAGDPKTFWRVNVEGTRTVLAAAGRAQVARVLHLSTTLVLGRDFPDGVDETGAVRMTGDPYTDTTVSAEHQALLAHAGGVARVTVARLGEVYGPHAQTWTVRPVELIRRNLLVLVDGGKGVLSPTYLDDAVAGSLAAATSDAGAGQVFHVTGGQGVDVGTFFGHYAAMLDKQLRSLPAVAARAVTGPVDLIARNLGWQPPIHPRSIDHLLRPGTVSIDKAERLLGWTPKVPLDEGMTRTCAWLHDAGLVPHGP